MSNKWAKGMANRLIRVQPIALMVLVVTSFRSAVALEGRAGLAMNAGILDGDRILVNKLSVWPQVRISFVGKFPLVVIASAR